MLLFIFKCLCHSDIKTKVTSFQGGTLHSRLSQTSVNSVCNCSTVSKNKEAPYLIPLQVHISGCKQQQHVTMKLTKWQQQQPHDSSVLYLSQPRYQWTQTQHVGHDTTGIVTQLMSHTALVVVLWSVVVTLHHILCKSLCQTPNTGHVLVPVTLAPMIIKILFSQGCILQSGHGNRSAKWPSNSSQLEC